MTIAQELLAEFEMQAPITRKFLERLPEGKYTWKPHSKSMSGGQLAYHIASVPGAVVRAVQKDTAEVPPFNEFPQAANRAELLKLFDDSVATVREALPQFDNAAMEENWRLTAGGREVLVQPRRKFLRDVLLSHSYHHRGQFGVYLRLLDVPVPASFGPSADEPPLFMQLAQAAA
jgi:uncharacterized damage-inducible protein DinB